MRGSKYQWIINSINRIFLLFMFLAGTTLKSTSQIAPQNRLTDWTRAGLQNEKPSFQHILFSGDRTGTTDNSVALKTILDTLTKPTMILFDTGNYLFLSTINIPNATILKGLGNIKTRFVFNQSSRDEPSIQIRGSQINTQYPLSQAALKDSFSILLGNTNAAKFPAGSFFRIMQNDSTLVFDTWAATRTGQIIRVDSNSNGKLFFKSPLRNNYFLDKNPRIIKVNPIMNAGIECLKITRQDYTNTGNGSSNIFISNAYNCEISSVESVFCNFAHIEMLYSSNILVEDCYLQDAHNFGVDGRGYGIMLHYTTGEVLVQNNIFRRLRHSMIIQGGANGNVFAYNYSYQTRKESLPGIFTPGEDMVLHGNYPYLNLFEGNYGQWASIDNSHGRNGPFNTFFRNISTTGGFNISNAQSDSQNVVGNQNFTNFNNFNASNHIIQENSWQTPATLNHPSLAYSTKPAFLVGYNLGEIGPPIFDQNTSIPARDRAIAGSPVSRNCGIILWDGAKWDHNFRPGLQTGIYQLVLLPGTNLLLNEPVKIKGIYLSENANLTISDNTAITIKGQ